MNLLRPNVPTASTAHDCRTSVTRVLVTGGSGNVGAATVAALQSCGIPVRAGAIEPRLAAHRFDGIDWVQLDFLDPTTFAPALEGCDALFLMRPPPIARVKPTLNRLIDVAAGCGVQHIVFSSVAGADTNPVVPHHRVETHLQSSGLAWTILRPGFFAQNLGDAYRLDIRDDHRLYVPAGRGRVAFIDVRDLADVAATVFGNPAAHTGEAYTLTGPEALTFDQVAAVLTDAIGSPIRYHPATVAGYLNHLHRRGQPMAQILVQTILHTGLRGGAAETVDETVERLLGRPARNLATYVNDHRDLWAPVA